MKKTHLLISSLALFATLTACGGNGGDSEPAKESDKASEVVQKPSDTVPPATEPAVVETIYEHQFMFNAPGKKIDAEGNTISENTLVEQAFEGTKHLGPNYCVFINLLKEGNAVQAGRTTLYYTGILANKAAWTVEGATWSKNADGIYTISMPAFTAGVFENPAATLTSDADGNVVWAFSQQNSATADPIAYSLTLNTQKSFAGEYTGVYYSITDLEATGKREENPIDSCEVVALADGTYTVSGAIEDSGISAYTGTIDALGVFKCTTPRLDGTGYGYFYTDVDGDVKFYWNMEARERKSAMFGKQI